MPQICLHLFAFFTLLLTPIYAQAEIAGDLEEFDVGYEGGFEYGGQIQIELDDEEFERFKKHKEWSKQYIQVDDGFEDKLMLSSSIFSFVLAEVFAVLSYGAKDAAVLGLKSYRVCSVTNGCMILSRTGFGAAIVFAIFSGHEAGKYFHQIDEEHNGGLFYGTIANYIDGTVNFFK